MAWSGTVLIIWLNILSWAGLSWGWQEVRRTSEEEVFLFGVFTLIIVYIPACSVRRASGSLPIIQLNLAGARVWLCLVKISAEQVELAGSCVVGFNKMIMLNCSSILQARTCKILSLAENPRQGKVGPKGQQSGQFTLSSCSMKTAFTNFPISKTFFYFVKEDISIWVNTTPDSKLCCFESFFNMKLERFSG